MKKTLCIVNLVCMASLAATAQAQTYYQDSFNRTGELNGTAPTTNTGGNHWTVSTGTGSYATNGSAVYDKKAAYDSAYLPVNGSSGVTLDGTKDFTLSATITPDTTSGYYLGISLSTNPTPTNLWDSGLATMSLGNGYSGVWQGGTNLAYDYFSAGTYTITINYSHVAGTITFKYGSTNAYTLTGVTAAQVAAVRSVTIGNSAATSAALLGNFTLTVGSSGGTAPAAPTSVAATGGNSQVVLNWKASSGATSYSIYRGTSSNGESALVTGITATSFTDSSVTNGTTYYYKVTAVNGSGASGYSSEANDFPAAGGSGDISVTGYTLSFDDEFNSLSVSSTSPKGSATWYGYPPNGGAGWFSSSAWNSGAFSVSGGVLNDLCWYNSTQINGQNWQSGYIASVDTTTAGFSQTYGYFEIRCQMPNAGDGAWPAFWLDSLSGITGGQGNEEVDIFEWYGTCNTPGAYYDLVQQTSHNWNTDGSQNTTTAPYLPSTSTPIPDGLYPWQGYHVYGVLITSSYMTWYIDGVQTNQCATPTAYMNTPFYVMINYAIGGGWPLNGTPFTTDGSSTFLVDWVRVYSLQ